MVTTLARAVMPVSPIATPMMAVSSGSPAAVSAPKVISRITKPMTMPISSGASEVVIADPGYTDPENSTCAPVDLAGATAASGRSASRS